MPPPTTKDPIKIEAYVAEKEEEWYGRAALSAISGRVLAIGYLDTRTDHLTEDVGINT